MTATTHPEQQVVRPRRIILASAALAALAWAAACGGDGTTDPPPPPPNRPPVAVGTIPAQTVIAGDTVTVDVASFFNDPDGDPLSYTVTTTNPEIALPTMAGSILTIIGVAAGTATATITATDPDGLMATQSISVTVEAANRAPEAVGTIPARTITAGQQATVGVSSYFSDPDEDTLSYQAATSNDAAATASVSGSDVTIDAVAEGMATITVTATDPDGLMATQSISVTVEAANRAPEAVGTIPARTITAGQQATVGVSSYFSDPDEDTLSYQAATSNDAAATASVSGSDVTIDAVAEGTATITVTATDPGGLTATQSISVTVEAANRAPEAVGTIPARTITAGQQATVDVSSYFSDPDEDTLSYQAATSNDAAATASVSGSDVTIDAVAEGMATITVTATDPDGLMATQSISVTVEAANRAPEAVGTIPARTITAGQQATVGVSSYFSDPDEDTLSYQAATSNDAAATASVSGSDVTIDAVAEGTATITVTATDPGGLTATQSISVTVEAANRAPEAVGTIPARTITAGQQATVDVSSYFSDPDEDTLSYEAETSETGVATASVSGDTVTIMAVAAGSATLTVTARDPGDLTATQRTMVTVNAGSPDRAALVALYNQTFGRGWKNNANWLTNQPLSTWYGVTTDAAGRVTALDLPDNLLRNGPLPAELGDLQNLKRLDLSANFASRRIPPELGKLRNLEWLDLSGVVSTSTPIPPELGNLHSLKRLDLSDRNIDGIPAELGNLQNLEWLDLSKSLVPYRATIPPELGNLRSLKRLDLSESNHNWDNLPPELGNLASLEWLDVSNALRGGASIPHELGNLRNLKWLDLSENFMGGSIPPELGNLVNLESLDLSRTTGLDGPIPPELGNLQSLERLDLSRSSPRSRNTVIPPELGNLQSLKWLDLSENRIKGQIPPEIGSLQSLKWLDLSENRIEGQIPPEIGSLQSLERMDLRENRLTGSLPPQLGDLGNLGWLDLSEIPALEGPIPLEFTNLSLERFHWTRTELCSPEDPAFQAWLRTISDHAGRGDCGMPNRPPEVVAQIPPQALTLGQSRSIDLSAHIQDPDGDPLEYVAETSNQDVVAAYGYRGVFIVSRIATGTATVELTASDPHGLTATQSFVVTVEPNQVFRDDFASSASLSNWELVNASAELVDGALELTNTVPNSQGFATRDLRITDWHVRARMARAHTDARASLFFFVDHPKYSVYAIDIGSGTTVNGEDTNYRLLVFDADENLWSAIAYGTWSDIEDGVGEFTDVAITVTDDYYEDEDGRSRGFSSVVFSAASTVLFDGVNNAPSPDLTGFALVVWPPADATQRTSMFDWIEVHGTAVSGATIASGVDTVDAIHLLQLGANSVDMRALDLERIDFGRRVKRNQKPYN